MGAGRRDRAAAPAPRRVKTVSLEVDGRPVTVPAGSTVMQAAHALGIYVPHFCYHPQLSIAANCRMCLVEIERAPKPMPACATPVSEGMKVRTASPLAREAQAGVMEFLLANHPLDCPICDQGGECQLQDLAVGYGKGVSRYREEKRVVLAKNLGPLVAAEEMSRCIHCTRCVRFGVEIAGVMELGVLGRGEHAEIAAFVDRTVDSELSGNMIDLCPVGALTSKPFRYRARTWELARWRSISPHDALGSNLVVQTKQHRVVRVLPRENEAVNECWLSDKDRFSYEALSSPERLLRPMLKKNGQWSEVGWPEALEAAAQAIAHAGADAAYLASPHATLEELHLVARLARATGAGADFRLRRSDFSTDGLREGIPWLGLPVAELARLDRVLVVGSFLRKDHPLLAVRLRRAARGGCEVHLLHSADDDPLMPVLTKRIVAPSALVDALAQVPASPIGASLASGRNVAVLLGNFAEQHPQAGRLHWIAQSLGWRFGFLGEAANSVGGYLAGLPVHGDVAGLLARPRRVLVFLNAEPECDFADPAAALAAARAAGCAIVLSAFRTGLDWARVLLPIAPFAENEGTYVSTEARVQSFAAAVRAAGEARPAWKVLRMLGALAGLPGFDAASVEELREECLAGREVAALLSNRLRAQPPAAPAPPHAGRGLERVADVPIYFADPLVRRAVPLQRTRDAQPPRARMCAATLARAGLAPGARVRVRSAAGEVQLEAALDPGVPEGCVRIATAHSSTAALGPLWTPVELAAVAEVA